MTMVEMAAEYRVNAQRIKHRIDELKEQRKGTWDRAEQLRLDYRIRTMDTLWRESRELANLLERYHDRRVKNDGRYTQ